MKYFNSSWVSTLFLCFFLTIPGTLPQWAQTDCHNVSLAGQWDGFNGTYYDVTVSGNYAYCVGDDGLDIIDVSEPASVRLISSFAHTSDEDSLSYTRVKMEGRRLYILSRGTLLIIDVSNPGSPSLWGRVDLEKYCMDIALDNGYAFVSGGSNREIRILDISGSSPPTPGSEVTYSTAETVYGLHISGDYLYAATEDGVDILNISNPAAPAHVTSISIGTSCFDVVVEGHLAFVEKYGSELLIYNITNPAAPVKVGEYTQFDWLRGFFVENSTLFVCDGDTGIKILDVSSPSSPELLAEHIYPGVPFRCFKNGDRLYVTDGGRGLRIVDVSEPSAPALLGGRESFGRAWTSLKQGDYLFIGKKYGLQILDVSKPSAPSAVSQVIRDMVVRTMAVKDSTLFLGAAVMSGAAFMVYDISNIETPVKLAEVARAGDQMRYLEVYGDYAYAEGDGKLNVYDISDPSNPAIVNTVEEDGFDFQRNGTTGYLLGEYELILLDLSTPASPRVLSRLPFSSNNSYFSKAMGVNGNLVYVSGITLYTTLLICDVSDPGSPFVIGRRSDIMQFDTCIISGNYAYIAWEDYSFDVLDLSNPEVPVTMGYCYFTWGTTPKMTAADGYIYVPKDYEGIKVYRFQAGEVPPGISVNRDELNFRMLSTGSETPRQVVRIKNTGGGTLHWNAFSFTDWVTVNPTGDSTGSFVEVWVTNDGLEPGTYTAELKVVPSGRYSRAETVSISLEVLAPGASAPPFGEVSTPTGENVVSGSVAFTGWALDDIGVENVVLYLESGNNLTAVGGGVFVEGARPDIEGLYREYPASYRAGWGYMMLTNFLPNGGNGSYIIRVVAVDAEGNETILDRRTIRVDNAGAVKPFGAIDTPTQGGLASGSSFANYGWVLTPQPNTIPTDGSTITVWVDQELLGTPQYNLFRSDIAELFPGYNNSGGAIGYFSLDTTKYANGSHIIYWIATDNAGNAEGIGSRYFTVQNSNNRLASPTAETGARVQVEASHSFGPSHRIDVDVLSPVWGKKGFRLDGEPEKVYPGDGGEAVLEIKELQRIEIALAEPGVVAGEFTFRLMSPLPVGAGFDADTGVFAWMPGPGFIGDYSFVFQVKDRSGTAKQRNLRVRILPKY